MLEILILIPFFLMLLCFIGMVIIDIKYQRDIDKHWDKIFKKNKI